MKEKFIKYLEEQQGKDYIEEQEYNIISFENIKLFEEEHYKDFLEQDFNIYENFMKTISNETKFSYDDLTKLEDYIYFKNRENKEQKDYEKIVNNNFEETIKILIGEFCGLINDDKDFNYNKDEFIEWLKDCVLDN